MTTIDGTEDDSGLPAAHPDFAAHFTDPLYEDPADDLAPFGSDEGWDLLSEWSERREDLEHLTLEEVLEESGIDSLAGLRAELDLDQMGEDERNQAQWEAALTTVSAAFTILRLTGSLDPEGVSAAVEALDLLITVEGDEPGLVREREDLLAWSQQQS